MIIKRSQRLCLTVPSSILAQTLVYEAAIHRLVKGQIPDDIQDEAERADAMAIIDNAPVEVVDLYALRNPVQDDVPVEPEVQPSK